MLKLKKEQLQVVLSVTFGNILEWFEIYSYAYLSPILAKIFLGQSDSSGGLIIIFLIFGSAFVARPFGGLIFGRLGDLIGRKKAFFLSIILLTIPTFLMGCLPTYSQIGLTAPLLLFLLRIFQAIPSSGEMPGTMCYLYEFANQKNKRFMTSWTGVGNQIGAGIAIIETFFMDGFTSVSFMETWGWRISFWSSGLIGLLGIYLRKSLHETPVFRKAKLHHQLDNENIFQILKTYMKPICLATAFGGVSGSTFYLIASYLPTYLDSSLGLNLNSNLLLTLSIILLSTILLPIIGKIGDRYDNRKMLLYSNILIVILLVFIFYTLQYNLNKPTLILGILFIIPLSCITALLGYIYCELFPFKVRFTGVGLSFNLADGIIGGFTPVIALSLAKWSGFNGAFCFYILATAVLSIIAILLIRKELFIIYD